MPRSVEPEVAANERIQDLCRALAEATTDPDLTLRFLRDLLSFRELQDIANRWAAARMLMAGATQTQTAQQLGMSTKTISEVALWVHGPFQTGGYWEVFNAQKAPDVTSNNLPRSESLAERLATRE
jgi:uncharacterized protein YerC